MLAYFLYYFSLYMCSQRNTRRSRRERGRGWGWKIGEVGREGVRGWGAILNCLPCQLFFFLYHFFQTKEGGRDPQAAQLDLPLLPRGSVHSFLINLCQLCLFLCMAECFLQIIPSQEQLLVKQEKIRKKVLDVPHGNLT